jgi:hypothetical protein
MTASQSSTDAKSVDSIEEMMSTKQVSKSADIIRCAIYSRYSTDQARSRSPGEQEQSCRKLAAQMGWEIIEGTSTPKQCRTAT